MKNSTAVVSDNGRKKLSFSQVSLFLKCPRQYKFKYRDKIPQKQSIVPMQSVAWHAVVEKNYRYKIVNKKDLPMKRMEELYKFDLKRLVRLAGGWDAIDQGKYANYEEVLAEGLEITRTHHKLIAPFVKPLGAEVKFSVKLNEEIELIGVWDVLEKGLIADNKAYSKTPSSSDFDKDLQFTLYAWAYKEIYGKIPKLRMDCIVKNKEPKAVQLFTTRSQKQIDWGKQLVIEVYEAMKSGGFFPNTNGWHCSPAYCSFWERCMG